MQPTSASVTTLLGLFQLEILDIKIRTEKEQESMRNKVQDGEDDKGRFERLCNHCIRISLLKLLLITNQMIVISTMMF